jgi:hypothetical protein
MILALQEVHQGWLILHVELPPQYKNWVRLRRITNYNKICQNLKYNPKMNPRIIENYKEKLGFHFNTWKNIRKHNWRNLK